MADYHCEESGRGYCLLRELLPLKGLDSRGVPDDTNSHVIGLGALEDISDGCKIDCIRKQIAAKRYNRRQIEQLRCIADYKYLLGEKERREVGFEEAVTRWVADGFAGVFSEVYARKKSNNEFIRHWDLYVDSEIIVNSH